MEEKYAKLHERTASISKNGSLSKAIQLGDIAQYADLSASEALVLGLLNQGVRKFVGVFGHGSTDIANVLSYYEEQNLVRTWNVRNEVEAAHCATMLRWHYGETAAVITSIGPGALQAFAGSLVAASNGLGAYFICGDETTQAEGPNMQAIPNQEQASFRSIFQRMGGAYQLHTPEAVFSALRKGAATVFHPTSARPFFFLAPMNVQPAIIRDCNLLELPTRPDFPPACVNDERLFATITKIVDQAHSVAIKLGGGADGCGSEIMELADLIDAVIVTGAKMGGIIPYSAERCMGVGGSKGSIPGNWAMNNADVVIVIGARFVCQWDCSGTAWKNASHIINFNSDPFAASHYNRSTPVVGDAMLNLQKWIAYLHGAGVKKGAKKSRWLDANLENKRQWERLKARRLENPTLDDSVWGRKVLTQPAAISIAYQFAKERKAARYFDAGDVQANGFQLVEDEDRSLTFSDTGSSYMGFAVSALLAGALADRPVYAFAFSGDGSFTMNPQILLDGVEHGVKGCILLFDNRRMGAITGLQIAQYKREYKTNDRIAVDYVALARSVSGVRGIFGGYSPEELRRALAEAYAYPRLSLIHIPVYYGSNELGGLGEYGDWNVGNWCEKVQREHHRIGL